MLAYCDELMILESVNYMSVFELSLIGILLFSVQAVDACTVDVAHRKLLGFQTVC